MNDYFYSLLWDAQIHDNFCYTPYHRFVNRIFSDDLQLKLNGFTQAKSPRTIY